MKRENVIPYEPVGRLIKAAGAERVSQNAKIELANYLEKISKEIGMLAVKYAKHAGRKTVKASDIKLANKHIN